MARSRENENVWAALAARTSLVATEEADTAELRSRTLRAFSALARVVSIAGAGLLFASLFFHVTHQWQAVGFIMTFGPEVVVRWPRAVVGGVRTLVGAARTWLVDRRSMR